jgi:hypothetical protein
MVFGPIPPGGEKQVSYSYVLPATTGQIAIAVDQPTGELDLLLEDTTTQVSGAGVESDGVQPIEQRRFASYRVRAPNPGTRVTLTFPRRGLHAQSLVPYAVLLVALALVIGLIVALRRKPG